MHTDAYRIVQGGMIVARVEGPNSLREEWRSITKRGRALEVSDLGRVRWNGRFLGQKVASGYLTIATRVAGVILYEIVHRLVLEAFVGECPAGHEARHLDGNRINNHRSNLEWSTHSENMDDQKVHGTRARCERTAGAKLTATQVDLIRERVARGEKQAALAREFGVTRDTIGNIIRGKSWTKPDALVGIKVTENLTTRTPLHLTAAYQNANTPCPNCGIPFSPVGNARFCKRQCTTDFYNRQQSTRRRAR